MYHCGGNDFNEVTPVVTPTPVQPAVSEPKVDNQPQTEPTSVN